MVSITSLFTGALKNVTAPLTKAYSALDAAVFKGALPGGAPVPISPKPAAAPISTQNLMSSASPQKASMVGGYSQASMPVASMADGSTLYSNGKRVTTTTTPKSEPGSMAAAAATAALVGGGIALAGESASGIQKTTQGEKMADSDLGLAGSITAVGRSLTQLAGSGGGTAGILSKLGTAGIIAGGLYGAEQIAEKLGVRGGAGFIGSRPIKRHKRMNVANVKALKRADRRIDGFIKTFRKVASTQGYTLHRKGSVTTCSKKK